MQISKEKLKKVLLHILVILLIIRLFFTPLYKEYKEKKEKFLKKVREYETTLVLKNKNTLISDDIINKVYSKEEISLIQTLLLGYVEDICKKNNIILSNFELVEPSTDGKVTEINIVLKLEGRPSQIIKFLNDIKKYPKILDVKNFEALETEQRYVFTVVLSTYRVEK